MLAIIIPFYKINFFEETLASLAAQTNKNFHVYIGNDASPDNPESLIHKYNKQVNITYKRFPENLGGETLTKHWDRCIGMTRDEKWLMVLGDDDVLGNTVVESFYKYYPVFDGKSNVIRFASRIITEKTKSISKVYEHPIWENSTKAYYRRFKNVTRSSLSEYIFLKKAYLNHGFQNYPLAWHSDDRAWLDFSDKKPIYSVNEAVVLFRNSDFNISGKTDNRILKIMASISFYKYFISTKSNQLNEEQKFNILRTLENLFAKRGKLKLQEWFFLLYFYFLNFKLYHVKKFVKRTLKDVIKMYFKN